MLASKLQASFKKTKKVQKDSEPIDIKDFLWSKLQEQVIDWLESVKPEVIGVIEKQIVDLKRNVKKGDPGKDYVLTPKDKEEIASKIKVPIVDKIIEKTQVVIKEQPIVTEKVTNQIIEKAVAEDANKITAKINTTENSIDPKVIIGLKDWMSKAERAITSKAPAKYYGGGDVVQAGTNVTVTRQNGKRVISSTGGSGLTALYATEVPDGIITVFTFALASTKPQYIVYDNVWMRETTAFGTTNWSWDNALKQATLALPPVDDIWAVAS